MASPLRILDVSTSIIGPATRGLPGKRNIQELSPGDLWELPYRGSRYTIKSSGDDTNIFWTRQGDRSLCGNTSKDFIEQIMNHKNGSLGSFRITPHREIIARYKDESTNEWPAVYVGKLEGKMEFKGFDLDPDLETGQLWTGFMFGHGEPFTVWSRDRSDNCLHWKRLGIHFRTVDEYHRLCSLVREIRPRGGRLYINEYGHIWMNVSQSIDLDVGHSWNSKIRDNLALSKKTLSKNEILLAATHDRVFTTKTYPIYVGKVEEFASVGIPRTHFIETAIQFFTKGREDPSDSYSYSRREKAIYN